MLLIQYQSMSALLKKIQTEVFCNKEMYCWCQNYLLRLNTCIFSQENKKYIIFSGCCPHLYCGKLEHNDGCSILWPSSSVPCLSGHRNNSTWEIIFKVWLLIKHGVQQSDLKMISPVESFLCPDKQETPEEGQRTQWSKHCFNL